MMRRTSASGGQYRMSKKKIWAFLTVVFLLAGTGVWAAQTKAPSKPAPAKEAGKAVTEKAKEHQATEIGRAHV